MATRLYHYLLLQPQEGAAVGAVLQLVLLELLVQQVAQVEAAVMVLPQAALEHLVKGLLAASGALQMVEAGQVQAAVAVLLPQVERETLQFLVTAVRELRQT